MPATAKRRLFVALGFPDSIRAHLAGLQDRSLSGVRWTNPANLHLTMRFVGETGREDEDRLVKRLRSVTVSSFTLRLGGFGIFPPRGEPRVVWAGVGSGHPLLFQLRQRVDDAILAAGLSCELRDFVPHITLGKGAGLPRSAFRQMQRRCQDSEGPVFSVKQFTLFESLRTPSGMRYISVEDFPLGS